MRAVVQRVTFAKVTVSEQVVGSVDCGLCVLVGVARGDNEADAHWLAGKVTAARVFSDAADRMNLSVADVSGGILAISQFTLLGDMRRGTRPSFSSALEPGRAEVLFELFCDSCRERGVPTETGRFRTHMEVSLENSGPVTLLIDSKKAF